MSAQLYRHTQIHQIFGANTDVGKTIFATALVRASASSKRRVFYLKPVSAGPVHLGDDRFIERFTKDLEEGRVKTRSLYQFADPVSPHLAARREDKSIPSDTNLVTSISKSIADFAREQEVSEIRSQVYVETAGGVHSPSPSGISQVETYRPLFIPTILIGDSRLGGISSTIAAYESLHIRGYPIDAIALFENEYYLNHEYLKDYFAERGVGCFHIPPPPSPHSSRDVDDSNVLGYFDSLAMMGDLVGHLEDKHSSRVKELESMPARSRDVFWWPFVQHGNVKSDKDVMVIDSAHGDFFSVHHHPAKNSSQLSPIVDSSASWWTQAFGHANSALALAAANAAGRYGHVMFPQATHLPALQLAERLVHHGPGKGWATRCFFSDDGSTAMEVALKMALRFTSKKSGGFSKDLGILGMAGSYHGDTIGAMDACQEGVYTCEWHNAKGYWIDPPTVGVTKGKAVVTLPDSIDGGCQVHFGAVQDIYSVDERLNSDLATTYRKFVDRTLDQLGIGGSTPPRIGALVIEPLVMGAGGMIFVDPLFQRILIDQVRKASQGDLPIIFDEVFVGLYRLGMESSTAVLGVKPDISVYAKILTGGVVPLAVTLASERVFEVFLSHEKKDALLHGHSYTAHAVGCAVANKTLDLIEDITQESEWREAKATWGAKPDTIWSFWSPEFVKDLSHHSAVNEVMALGTLLAFRISDDTGGYVSMSAQTVLSRLSEVAPPEVGDSPPFGVHFRTLGDVAYFMGSLNTPSDLYRAMENMIISTIKPSNPV